jgi:hypothetical protein
MEPTLFDLVAKDELLPQPSERQKKRPSPSSSDSEEAPVSKKKSHHALDKSPTIFDLVVVDEALELDESMPQPSKRQKKRPSPSSSDSEAPASKRKTRRAIHDEKDFVAKKPRTLRHDPNNPAYFDDLLGATRIKELNDTHQATKRIEHDAAYDKAMAIWDKMMSMQRLMDQCVRGLNETSFEIPPLNTTEVNATYYMDFHKLYMELVGVLSGFFNTNFSSLESRVLYVASQRRLDFVAVWAQCKLAFPLAATSPNRSWLKKEFYKKLEEMVKGSSENTFCKGLIPMLKAHLKWQDSPEVEKAINALEECIQRWSHYYFTAVWNAEYRCKKSGFKDHQARGAKKDVLEHIMQLFGVKKIFFRDYYADFAAPEPTFKIWEYLRWRNE